MLTEWILFLAGNLFVCAGFVLIGKSIAHNPPGDREVPLAFRSKKMPEGDAAWNLGQKTFGSVLTKGGYGLMILNVAAMLAIISMDRTALNIAGTIMLVLELLYFFAARIYTSRILSRLPAQAETQSASAAKDDAQDQPEKPASPLQETNLPAPAGEEEEKAQDEPSAAEEALIDKQPALSEAEQKEETSTLSESAPEPSAQEKMPEASENQPETAALDAVLEAETESEAMTAVRHYRHARRIPDDKKSVD